MNCIYRIDVVCMYVGTISMGKGAYIANAKSRTDCGHGGVDPKRPKIACCSGRGSQGTYYVWQAELFATSRIADNNNLNY